MPEFTTLKQLELYLKKEIENSLRQDVAPKVIEVAKERVQKDVYDVYSPKVYERSGQLKESFKKNDIPDGVEIENTRKDGSRYIPEVIEYGHDKSSQGYEYPVYYPSGDNYLQPRPFMANTENEILEKNIHTEELKKSLRTKGMDIT
jgi:hypothetical protein